MSDDRPDFFGEPVAASYDDDTDVRFSEEHLALESGFLAELAGEGGRALELAIGTGRVALPLAARGVEVHGIDLSEAMVARLRAKPGGDGDPGDDRRLHDRRRRVRASSTSSTWSSTRSATSPARTPRWRRSRTPPGTCGPAAASSSRPGCPASSRRSTTTATGSSTTPTTHHGIDEYDPVTQLMWSHHYSRTDDGSYRRNSVPFRYAWPAEFDLMARLAGMRLRERWAWWDRTPFTADSHAHVSVWEKE